MLQGWTELEKQHYKEEANNENTYYQMILKNPGIVNYG
jgi:hypothetical protein